MINVIDLALIGLAFSAGIVAFFNPCSYALLPAYISYYLGKHDDEKKTESILKRGLEGVGVGIEVTLGFLSVFVIIGVLISLVSSQIGAYLSWLIPGVSIILIILGLLWLLDIPLSFPHSFEAPKRGKHVSFYLFGVLYALGSAACVLPIFLMVTLSALTASGFLSGLLVFLSYALGMGIMMIGVAIAVALSKNVLLEHFKKIMRYVRKTGAIILIAAGIYLIYFWYTTYVV
ncbi:hypothetical protein AKJ48_03225 [candidate division MSBL1 archaeon SCGC-AAA261O19]|uniref:Cytochrome C biogenesis protein transmembrane domain-containing protein n=2 Tax=candidate division MSBL1 TaxID=215777 RepID=A0A133V062_9EURY|nr:hypothetical protein AKJ42_02375 [candidate division MSBL1 archaeon SCGC-AAA261C02]KXB04267.1 hypothetical protein AKJ48_03225 [candidate division MSBL1 archaeon SCGC-AAA261O19]